MKKDGKKVDGGNAMTKQILYIPYNAWSELLTIANYPFGERRYDGKIYKVIEHFIELYGKDKEKKKDQYKNRLKALEDRLADLEKYVYNELSQGQGQTNESVKTFAD